MSSPMLNIFPRSGPWPPHPEHLVSLPVKAGYWFRAALTGWSGSRQPKCIHLWVRSLGLGH